MALTKVTRNFTPHGARHRGKCLLSMMLALRESTLLPTMPVEVTSTLPPIVLVPPSWRTLLLPMVFAQVQELSLSTMPSEVASLLLHGACQGCNHFHAQVRSKLDYPWCSTKGEHICPASLHSAFLRSEHFAFRSSCWITSSFGLSMVLALGATTFRLHKLREGEVHAPSWYLPRLGTLCFIQGAR